MSCFGLALRNPPIPVEISRARRLSGSADCAVVFQTLLADDLAWLRAIGKLHFVDRSIRPCSVVQGPGGLLRCRRSFKGNKAVLRHSRFWRIGRNELTDSLHWRAVEKPAFFFFFIRHMLRYVEKVQSTDPKASTFFVRFKPQRRSLLCPFPAIESMTIVPSVL